MAVEDCLQLSLILLKKTIDLLTKMWYSKSTEREIKEVGVKVHAVMLFDSLFYASASSFGVFLNVASQPEEVS